MPDLTKHTPQSGPARPKVVLLRPAARSVRPEDDPSRSLTRVALVVSCAFGAVGLLWLAGHVGFRLGFAPAMGVPELLAEPGEGLAGGVRMLLGIPAAILRAGLADPIMLLLWFTAIAIPGAALSAARPRVPGAPRPSALAITMSWIGGTLAMITAALVIAWSVGPHRAPLVVSMPARISDFGPWLDRLQALAGYDALAVVTAVLWVVLVFRMPLEPWFRVLAATFSFAGAVAVIAAFSISAATAAQVTAPRSLCVVSTLGSGPDRFLLLGYTRQHVAVLRIVQGTTVIDLVEPDRAFTIVKATSIAEVVQPRPGAGVP